ncbi:CoB--CoM heterodisulfide reductase iron-sulfur subunit A family protein [Methanocalculus chunghsingensis]|uniref:CoB--CoM heterodisulfide reductase iron-sulfur subunit A family protein n=1 Tax=Methanocalculus chunghsingensis TaxID=156457 RepID=UPI001B8B5E78|nr:CoB--CoM heterodisulfide reductase iron-sulfur subunit A family protein [Methanocalculus chunghsingensis]
MRRVVVIGGGVAGIQAALDVANHHIPVTLIEREPSIGGHMAQLDKTFPTNDCSMCILSPKMVDVERHPLITIKTLAEVTDIEGEVGAFRVTVRQHPRYVDATLCNGCGDCVDICPVEVYNRFDAGVGVRKAIYKPHPQIVPNIVVRDAEHCIECGLCYDICGREAVLREDTEKMEVIEAASVIIATGYQLFDATRKAMFGYLRYPDVITSLEFERLINASGPTRGEVRRLSDGAVPRSVVFVQCVGSRDMQIGKSYCSSVCCMYALKNAMLIREHHPETEVTILYNDIRAYGKGYEEYCVRAEASGVHLLRAFPGEVMAGDTDLILPLEDTETGEFISLHADLVVLSAGIEPVPDTQAIVEQLGIPLDQNGFVNTTDLKLDPVGTIRPGIYVAGTVTAPRDIPDSVMTAGAAAMRATRDALATGE